MTIASELIDADAKKCSLCGGINAESENVGDVLVVKCHDCHFQYIPNNMKYLGEEYFASYFERSRKKMIIL